MSILQIKGNMLTPSYLPPKAPDSGHWQRQVTSQDAFFVWLITAILSF